jgi:hypothetical protein
MHRQYSIQDTEWVLDSTRRVLIFWNSSFNLLFASPTTMLIAIVGTPSAGKRTVLQYLIEKHGFTEVGLEHPADPMEGSKLVRPYSVSG